MNRGNHVFAVDAKNAQAGRDEMLLTEEVGSEGTTTDSAGDADWSDTAAWDAEEQPVPRRIGAIIAPLMASLAIAGWTGVFVWSKRAALTAPPSLDEALAWIAAWSAPVLLVCVLWLLVMRTSRREAARFNDAANMLGAESTRLSNRLSAVNSELSLAREFIAAQSRDLDSLGRIAVDRLSQNAEKLQSLIITNSQQIESIGTVSTAALENMEKLRGQLPVIANAARDVTNNIGNAGRTAHLQLQELVGGFKRLNEFGQASERQVEAVRTLASETMQGLIDQSSQLEEVTARRFDEVVDRSDAVRRGLDENQARALEQFEAHLAMLSERTIGLAQNLDQAGQAAATALAGQMASIDLDLAERERGQTERLALAEMRSAAVARQIAELDDRLAAVTRMAEQADAKLAASVTSLDTRLTSSRSLVGETDREIGALTDASVRLLELIKAGSQHSREDLPASLSEAEARLTTVESRVAAIRNLTEEAAALGDRLTETLDGTQGQLASATQGISVMHGRIEVQTGAQSAALSAIRTAIDEISRQSSNLSEKLETELAQSIGRIAAERGALLAGEIEQAVARASEAGRETTIQLRDQLARVDELAGNLERRVAHARERAEEHVENDFARRVALITESLNSHAIDISRALHSDVSDTSWAAYLKGDRGIFTRRAVSLLQAGESKSVMQAYENDSDFQGHVNRYIHDFEAMLRQVLSTRDGDALGVTLLSSDMGKLYVALAQAIERLRR